MRVLSFLAAATLAAAAAPAARAEVTESSDAGFAIRIAFDTEASAPDAFDALVDVASWWHPDHTYSLDAGNLSLELSPGGCFCEVWDGGATKHAEVVQVRDGAMVRWAGGLGPLQDFGVSQVHDWTVEAIEGGARVSYVTRVGGHGGEGLVEIAPIVDAVMTEQLGRLERYLATGDPAPAE